LCNSELINIILYIVGYKITALFVTGIIASVYIIR